MQYPYYIVLLVLYVCIDIICLKGVTECCHVIVCVFRNTKCDGLTSLRRITLHHPEALCSQLHAITISVIAEVSSTQKHF